MAVARDSTRAHCVRPCRRESDDAYAGVVARLNARWRAIVCRDAI